MFDILLWIGYDLMVVVKSYHFGFQNTPERKRGSRPQSLTGSGISAELTSSLSIAKDNNEMRGRSDSSISLQPQKKSKSLLL